MLGFVATNSMDTSAPVLLVLLENLVKSSITVLPTLVKIMQRVLLTPPELKTIHARVPSVLPDLSVTRPTIVPPIPASTGPVQSRTTPTTVPVMQAGMGMNANWKTSVAGVHAKTTEIAPITIRPSYAHVQTVGWVTTAPKPTHAIHRSVLTEEHVLLTMAPTIVIVQGGTMELTARTILMNAKYRASVTAHQVYLVLIFQEHIIADPLLTQGL